MTTDQWAEHLAAFHAQRPGITEQVLVRAAGADGDAYAWLEAAGIGRGRSDPVLDVACGNGALWARLGGPGYVGVDVSAAELAAARARGVPRLVYAAAAALPIRTASVATVVCSMALHILAPLPRVLAEISRVLRPGGRLIATVPAGGPLRGRDLPAVAGLLAALGRRPRYPNDVPADRLALLRDANLRPLSVEQRRYTYPMRAGGDADLFLASLYLPGLPAARRRVARGYLHALARARIGMPIPIRRIVAIRE